MFSTLLVDFAREKQKIRDLAKDSIFFGEERGAAESESERKRERARERASERERDGSGSGEASTTKRGE